ncbi:SMI1/KNR4 family protein [Actinoplanes bogorensis]|uniref:SMI1/KNR4 family protein n=1 Tax=Paractinoplanes bogorensis TaxID=1610840 RepID=A0ABS5YRR6_9ACTN|nr:SMI1/KNR4 family protein [Actinoplanes bogorensis]MBU2666016.1 SMI1/KNR4 family protein [Actinoplanes bogorensis]
MTSAVAEFEDWVRRPLPEAVREWFLDGSDERLAEVSGNRITRVQDLGGAEVARFLDSGHLLLETDSQHCCRLVVPITGADGDPPVFVIDPDDEQCVTRTRYADSFSDYGRVALWDARPWGGGGSADFDHALPPGALRALAKRLTVLPVTYEWAANQSCDAIYRFDGVAQVAVAVVGATAVWSVVVAPSPAEVEELSAIIGTR